MEKKAKILIAAMVTNAERCRWLSVYETALQLVNVLEGESE